MHRRVDDPTSPHPEPPPKDPERSERQVGESPNRTRGPLVLATLIWLFIALYAGYQQVQSMFLSLPTSPSLHQEVDFPAKLAQAMRDCHHQNGDSTYFNVPVIGPNDGIFMRVVEARNVDGVTMAGDPFRPNINWHPLSALDRSALHDCRYGIEQFGVIKKYQVMPTYDDGPTPKFTSQLLDIQAKAEHDYGIPVKFTFFPVGRNAMIYPGLIAREVAAGNSVGNHSMTHPQFANLDNETARQEIVLTSRAISSASGLVTALSREPMRGPDRSAIQLNLRFVILSQQGGMFATGYNEDRKDYELDEKHIPIQLPALDGRGLVLLLHDGGGKDRSGTVDFTRRLVKAAYQAGYSFITADELLQQASSPIVSQHHATSWTDPATWTDKLTVWYYRDHGHDQMVVLTIFTVIMGSFTMLYLLISVKDARKWRRRYQQMAPYDPEIVGNKVLTFLVAAWDEALNIAEMIDSVIACYHDDPDSCQFYLQFIVVSDGSIDGTNEIVKGYARRYNGHIIDHEQFEQIGTTLDDIQRVRVDAIIVPRGGKASALTTGLLIELEPVGRIIEGTVCMQSDADCALDPGAIGYLASHFNDPTVGMVCGRIEAHNRTGLTYWGRFLRLFLLSDYVVGVTKRGGEQAIGGQRGCIGIVPGCIVAYLVQGLPGGVPLGNRAEDYASAMRLRLELPDKSIRQDVRAVVRTEVPFTILDTINQLIRWSVGPIQVAIMFWRVMLSIARFGPLSWLVQPQSIVNTIMAAVVIPLSYITAFNMALHGHALLMVAYYCFFILIRMIQLSAAMYITGEWSWPRFWSALYYRPINDPLQFVVAWLSIWTFCTGEIAGWTRPPRVGSATISEEALV